MVFQLRREALLIHFIHFMLGRMPRAGGFPASLLFFERGRIANVIRFSPWFQLYGEALLIHFFFPIGLVPGVGPRAPGTPLLFFSQA